MHAFQAWTLNHSDNFPAREIKKSAKYLTDLSETDTIRTCDLVLRRDALYPKLSYNLKTINQIIGLTEATGVEPAHPLRKWRISNPLYYRSTTLPRHTEREGFEPPIPCGITVFKTAAFDHSAIAPNQRVCIIRYFKKSVNSFYFFLLFFWKCCMYYTTSEREGFEPPIPCGITDFDSAAFDHSAIAPNRLYNSPFKKNVSITVAHFFCRI